MRCFLSTQGSFRSSYFIPECLNFFGPRNATHATRFYFQPMLIIGWNPHKSQRFPRRLAERGLAKANKICVTLKIKLHSQLRNSIRSFACTEIDFFRHYFQWKFITFPLCSVLRFASFKKIPRRKVDAKSWVVKSRHRTPQAGTPN